MADSANYANIFEPMKNLSPEELQRLIQIPGQPIPVTIASPQQGAPVPRTVNNPDGTRTEYRADGSTVTYRPGEAATAVTQKPDNTGALYENGKIVGYANANPKASWNATSGSEKSAGAVKHATQGSNKEMTYLDAYKMVKNQQESALAQRLADEEASRTQYLSDQERLRDAYRAQTEKEQADALAKSNTEYDSAARQNYINYMRARKSLPAELNALGINGGASESSLIRMGANYGTNTANNEAARASALAALRQQYARQLFDYDQQYEANRAASDKEYRDLVASLRNETANNIATAYATALQNQITAAKEKQDKDLQNFANTIEGRYKSVDSYKKLIQRLKDGNDPNKATKIALARQAMNKLDDKGSGGGGGGGGGRSSGRSVGTSGYSGGGGGSSSGSDTVARANSSGASRTANTNAAKQQAYKNTRTTSGSSRVNNRNARWWQGFTRG